MSPSCQSISPCRAANERHCCCCIDLLASVRQTCLNAQKLLITGLHKDTAETDNDPFLSNLLPLLLTSWRKASFVCTYFHCFLCRAAVAHSTLANWAQLSWQLVKIICGNFAQKSHCALTEIIAKFHTPTRAVTTAHCYTQPHILQHPALKSTEKIPASEPSVYIVFYSTQRILAILTGRLPSAGSWGGKQ